MLTENDIVTLLTDHLRNKGYKIIQALKTTERGIDIIAENINHILYIEAKGETSSQKHTSRYGNAFDNNQIKSHVSRAILSSMKILHDRPAGSKTKAAIALPDTPGHRDLVAMINNPIRTLGIKIFFVTENHIREH